MNMQIADLKNKVAVVTGAGGGLGRRIACALAEQGAKLAICDVHESRLRETADALSDQAALVVSVQTDIADEKAVRRFYERFGEHAGRLDILVNCAALWDAGDVTDISGERLDRVLGVNLKGTFYMCREAFPLMRAGGSGSIVNFASTAGEYGSIRPAAHYAASKGGVIALSKSLAREGAEHQIRVNIISPGPTDTPMLNIENDRQRKQYGERTLLGRVGHADDMASAVLYLASSASSWVTGEVLRVNGGSLL